MIRFCEVGELSNTGTCFLVATVWCPDHGDICAAHEVLYHGSDCLPATHQCRRYWIDWSIKTYPTAECAVAVCPNYQPAEKRNAVFPLCPAHEDIFD